MRAPSLTALALLALACSVPAPESPAQEAAAEAQASAAQPAAAAEGTQPGERAPDFILPTSEGGGFSLSAHRGKPVVLVFFRGTW